MLSTTMRSVFTTAMLFMALLVHAQDPRIADSLGKDLSTYPFKDTVYLDKLQALQGSLIFVMPDSVCKLARLAQHIADSLGDTKRLARATNMLGNCYKTLGLLDRAMETYVEALKLFEQVGDEKWLANMHTNIGLIHIFDKNYQGGLQEEMMALSIRKRIGYYKGVSAVYNAIGTIYDAQKQWPEALHYFELALDSAANDGPYNRAVLLGNIGNIYGLLEQFDISREMIHEALAIHASMGLNQEMSRDLHNIGETFLMQDMLDSAIAYNLRAFVMADSLGDYEAISAISENLKRAYAKLGEFDLAFGWADRMIAAKDTLALRSLTAETRTMELMYRVEKEEQAAKFDQERTLMQKDASIRRQSILLVSMGLSVVLLVAFGIVLWRRIREKQLANAKLEFKVTERTQALSDANAQLSHEIEDKEAARQALHTFIYRSSHDLKGPLTTIKGIVQVAQAEPDASPYIDMIGAKAEQLDGVLQQLIDKVEVYARVPHPQRLDLQTIWRELQSELSHRAGYDAVRMDLLAEGTVIEADPVLFKIALRQLLQNAIDFRRNDAPDNACTVVVDGEGLQWQLQVLDRGIGIAPVQQARVFEMFTRGSNQSVGAGLGLYIVRDIATKLGATIAFEPTETGTTVRLQVG
jgi:signal transduction histidine kinase